jgi:hypothetical protein
MPVGLLKLLNPLGHWGHLKLQEVVGSMENEIGFPQWMVFLVILER